MSRDWPPFPDDQARLDALHSNIRTPAKEPAVSAQTPTTATPTTAERFHKRAEKRASPAEISRMRQRIWNIRGSNALMPETVAELLAVLADAEDSQADSLKLCAKIADLTRALNEKAGMILDGLRDQAVLQHSFEVELENVLDLTEKNATLEVQLTALQSAVAQVRKFAESGRDSRGFGPENYWRIGYREACSDILSRLPASPVETEK